MFSISASSIKRKLLSIVIFSSIGVVAVPASAAVVHIVENGILMGANNVDVAGNAYDVRFINGTYDSAFTTTPAFFGNRDIARQASQSLLDNVFEGTDIGTFSSPRGTPNGCSFNAICFLMTPVEFGPFGVASMGAVINEDIFDPFPDNPWLSGQLPVNLPLVQGDVWAVWTPANVAAIPEPSTYAMMGLGLLGLMGIARRRQN